VTLDTQAPVIELINDATINLTVGDNPYAELRLLNHLNSIKNRAEYQSTLMLLAFH
jgi:hypothetical protein